MSFAKVVLSGEIISEPEKRFTPNNHAVTSFTILVDNTGGKEAEPFQVRVTCWRNLAEAAAEQLQKGEFIAVDGKLIMSSPPGQDAAAAKKGFEVEAISVEKLGSKPQPVIVTISEGGGGASAGNGNNYASAPRSSATQPAAATPVSAGSHFSSDDLLTEDDIPF